MRGGGSVRCQMRRGCTGVCAWEGVGGLRWHGPRPVPAGGMAYLTADAAQQRVGARHGQEEQALAAAQPARAQRAQLGVAHPLRPQGHRVHEPGQPVSAPAQDAFAVPKLVAIGAAGLWRLVIVGAPARPALWGGGGAVGGKRAHGPGSEGRGGAHAAPRRRTRQPAPARHSCIRCKPTMRTWPSRRARSQSSTLASCHRPLPAQSTTTTWFDLGA